MNIGNETPPSFVTIVPFRHHKRGPMDRKQFESLENWIATPDRKPLILRGARQVGKSTLVRLFAERSQRPARRG